MELTEISDRIDARLNSFDQGVSADEYEKSLYLTKVQKELYYGLLSAFEKDGIISNILRPFLRDHVSTTETTPTPFAIPGAQFFEIPSDVEKIVYETAKLNIPSDLTLHQNVTNVFPTKIGEIPYKLDNPFREPDGTDTIRVINEEDVASNAVELHAAAPVSEYSLKYFKTVEPIILEALPTGLSIDGISVATNTAFNDKMLNMIIEGAVTLIRQDKAVQKLNV